MLKHPIALVALALLVVNDHVLKAAWPGVVTGKLSDFAGLAFFPLLLAALWELRAPATPRVLAVCCVLTGVVFALVKTTALGGDAYRWGLGLLQWPWHALRAGGPVPLRPVRLTDDPTDLVALPALGLAWWSGLRRARP